MLWLHSRDQYKFQEVGSFGTLRYGHYWKCGIRECSKMTKMGKDVNYVVAIVQV